MNIGLVKGMVTVGVSIAVVSVAAGLVSYAGFRAVDAAIDAVKGKRKKAKLQDPFGDIRELDKMMVFFEELEKQKRKVTIGGIEFEKSN